MSLSDKRTMAMKDYVYSEKDVKEFIKELKEEINNKVSLSPTDVGWIDFILTKLAGKDLI